MNVTIINAQTYSINNGAEMAYEVEYSEGSRVRAVESAGSIRKEYRVGDTWILSGKPYVVAKNARRHAEQLREACKAFLAA